MAQSSEVPVLSPEPTPDSCLTCAGRRNGLLGDLSIPAILDLQRIETKRSYLSGEILFGQGERPDGLFLLCKGRVKVFIGDNREESVLLGIADPGALLGLNAVISGDPHAVTAAAVWPSEASFVAREDFLHFLREHHEVWLPISRQLTRYCERACQRIRTLALPGSSLAKLAHVLLEWSRSGDEGGVRESSVAPLERQEEIGRMIGASRETTNRLFRLLRRQRIAEMRGSILHVMDPDALRRLAGS